MRGCGRTRSSPPCPRAPGCRSRSTPSRGQGRRPRSACPAAAKGNVEGYLFPVDLRVPGQGDRDPAAQDHGGQGRSASSTKAGCGRGRTASGPSSWPRIVEGEVSGDADRGKVARVIENRLAHHGPPDLRPPADGLHGPLRRAEARHAVTEPTPTGEVRTPTTPTRTGPAAGPDQQPGRRVDRGGGATRPPARWFYFVTVEPRHGRDHVRDHAGRARPQQRAASSRRGATQAEVRPVLNAARRPRVADRALAVTRCCTRAGYRALGLDRLDVRRARARAPTSWRAGWRAWTTTWRGLSLTMPLKEVAFAVADTVSETARADRRRPTPWSAATTSVGRPQHRRGAAS